MMPTRAAAAALLATLAAVAPVLPRGFSGSDDAAPDVAALARKYNVAAVAIAGVVMAERALNRHIDDLVEDEALALSLRTHDERWWANWAARGENQARRADAMRLQANKWPVALVATGYVVSFGPAQVTPRTVLRACTERTTADSPVCRGSVKEILDRLLSPRAAMELAGVVLDAEASAWERQSSYAARNDVALLGTLYSMGGDYYRARHPDPTVPVYNAFGAWIAERCRERTVADRLSVACDLSPASSDPP